MLQRRRATMAISFKGAHFPQEIILTGVRWYVAYPLSTRHVEELLRERGVHVDLATINRWVIKYSPQLEAAFHRRKRPVWVSWRSAWMKRIFGSRASGVICIGRSITTARPLTSCSRSSRIKQQLSGF